MTKSGISGAFEFPKVPVENYILSLSLVGYRPVKIRISKSSREISGLVNLGKISMSPLSNDLKVVTVSGIKPLVVQQADRLSYDVQADPDSRASNALDMLRKVPLLSVDGSDNIRLKGSNSYRMLINGKASSLVSNNPADLLKAMPADNIDKIEVITTPPAKYDAEGLAGIINIITHRKLSEGYSVNLTSTYNTVNGPSGNVNIKARYGRFGLQGYIGTAQPVEQRVATGYRNSIGGAVASELVQDGTMVHDRDNSFGSAQLSFQADSLNLFTAELEYHQGGSDQQIRQVSNYLDSRRSLNQSYELASDVGNELKGTDLSVNHELSFKRAKRQLLTSSYKYSHSRDIFFNNAIYLNTLNYTSPDYSQRNRSGSHEHTAQVDYLHPVRSLEIELGAKAIFRSNFSQWDAENLDRIGGTFQSDLNPAQDLDYQQNIYSLYNSYHLRWKDWDGRAGLRLERSSVDADFSITSDQINQRYTNLFPSLSVQRNLSTSNSVSLGYQQRMERPGILLLNPFVDYTNPGFVRSGNPNLEAVLNHSIDLIYSNYSKNPFTLGFSYAFANNTIEQITLLDNDQVSRTSYLNVGKRKAASLILNATHSFTPRLNTTVDAQIMRIALGGFIGGQEYSNTGFQGHVFSNTRYRFEKGYRLGVDVSYDSRYVLLQGSDNDFLYYSLNASKDLFADKATVSVSSSNFFNKYARLDYSTRGLNFNQRSFNDIYYRRFNIRVIYKFGKLKGDIKTNQRGIRNDDQSTSRSNPS